MFSLAFASEQEVATVQCGVDAGKHIRLADYHHNFFPESAQMAGDVYAGTSFVTENYGRGSGSDWATMEDAAPGAETFCDKVAPVINRLGSDFFSFIDTEDQEIKARQDREGISWAGTPDEWQDTIVTRLTDARCAISPRDPAVLDYMKTQSYYFAQLKRMSIADKQRDIFAADQFAAAINAYNEKLANLKNTMNGKQADIIHLLESSRSKRPTPALMNNDMRRKGTATTMDVVNYDQAAEFLLSTGKEGESEGVRGVLHGIRTSLALSAGKLETAAQIVKRDAIRYSKLNQIANEHERLDSFKNRVREAAFGLLRNCLVNYQITNEIPDIE